MMAGSVWDDIPEEDRGFLASWYETIDSVGYGSNGGVGQVPPPEAQAAQVVADADARQTFADKIRSYLLRTEDLDRIEPPTPLIDGILYLDTLAWIIGKPGCGKSFVALDWAGHIGKGSDWQGITTTEGPVLYISPESPGGVRQRVRAWEAAHRRPMDGVIFLPMAVQAKVDGHWSALMEVAAELHPVLIILDTQARMSVGMDENSASDMGVFIDKVERLRAATKACLLIVHHTSRAGGHLRGSTAMEGAASTIITTEKVGPVITLKADPDKGGKTKDTEPFDPITLRLVTSASSAVLAGDRQRPVAGNLAGISEGTRANLAAWWRQHGRSEVTGAQLNDENILADRTLRRVRSTLKSSGLVIERRDGRSLLLSMTRDPLEE